MNKSVHIAMLLTLLGILILLIMPHFLPLRPQATLTIISAKLENISKLQATMDVQHVFTYDQCQAWRGFLDGHLIAVGVMGTDPQKAEVCTDWLLRKFSTRLVLITDEFANGEFATSVLPTESALSTNNGQGTSQLERTLRREATYLTNSARVKKDTNDTDLFAHHLDNSIQQPINALVTRIARNNNTPWIIVSLSKTPTQKDALLTLTREMLKLYNTPETTSPTTQKPALAETPR